MTSFSRGTVVALTAAGTALALLAAPAAAQAGQSSTTPSSPATPHSATRGLALTHPAAVHLVAGEVLGTGGLPLAGVCVVATGRAGVAVARTSAAGRYELAVPQAGGYVLKYRACQAGAAASGQTPAAARQVQVSGSATEVPAVTLDRAAATASAQALAAAGVATPRQPRLVRLSPAQAGATSARSGGVAGRVTNASGRPLSGICVWVLGNGFGLGLDTSRHGTYRIVSQILTPGRYQVEFESSCDSFPLATGPWAPEWYKGKFSSSQAAYVRIRAGRVTTGIDAVMRHDGEISGTVTGAGHGIRNACVVVTNSAGVELSQATTTVTGHYLVTGLDPASDRVLFVPGCTNGGISDFAPEWYGGAQGLAKAAPVQVRLGHVTAGIDIVLRELGTVTGQVRLGSKTGRPLGGMCISVFSSNPALAGGFSSTAKNGTYSIEGLPAGRYQVEANAGCGDNGNYAPATYPHTVTVVDGKTDGQVNIYVQPGAIVSGTVTDASTGLPLGGVCVGDDNGDSAVTGSNGGYELDQLPAGRTQVSFSGGCGNHGSYAPQWYRGQSLPQDAANVELTAGRQTSGIDAALLPGATILGRVTNSAGNAAGGVCVSAVAADGSGVAYTQLGSNAVTSSSGAYSMANLAPGQYSVSFYGGCEADDAFAAAQQWFLGQPTSETAGLVDAPAGAPVSGIDAVIARSGQISGTISDTSGDLLDFGCVTAISPSTGLAGGDETFSLDGAYTLPGLAPGRYTVVATGCGAGDLAGVQHPGVVRVRTGRTTAGVDFALPAGGTITGRVTIARSGAPARGVCVYATPVGTSALDQLTFGFTGVNAAGRYRVTGLSSGRYRIAVQTTEGCLAGQEDLGSTNLRGTVKVTEGGVTSGVNASVGQGGKIAGQVTGPGGQAVPGACVEVFAARGLLVDLGTTTASGSYSESGLAPGRYTVEFNDPYCSDGPAGLGVQWYGGAISPGAALAVTVRADKTTSGVSAVLPADGAISGTVSGPGSSPLAGVCVSAVPTSDGLSTVYTVTSAGSYELTNLVPGTYRVEFQSGCGLGGLIAQSWPDVVSVPAGGTVTGIDVVMARR